MSVFEFGKLLRHYWAAVVACVLVCIFIALAWTFFTPSRYTATSKILPYNSIDSNASSVAQSIAAIAKEVVEQSDVDDASVSIDSQTGNIASYSVSISVSGADAEACASQANTLAAQIVESADLYFQSLKDRYTEEFLSIGKLMGSADEAQGKEPGAAASALALGIPWTSFCDFTIDQANGATRVGTSPAKLYALAALLGLCAAFLVVACIGMIKRPIKSASDVERCIDIPFLNPMRGIPAEESVATAVLLSDYDGLDSICLLPLSAKTKADLVDSLKSTLERGSSTSFYVSSADPIASTLKGMSIASSESTATVLCCRKWVDSMTVLEDASAEISRVGVKAFGVVLLP